MALLVASARSIIVAPATRFLVPAAAVFGRAAPRALAALVFAAVGEFAKAAPIAAIFGKAAPIAAILGKTASIPPIAVRPRGAVSFVPIGDLLVGNLLDVGPANASRRPLVPPIGFVVRSIVIRTARYRGDVHQPDRRRRNMRTRPLVLR